MRTENGEQAIRAFLALLAAAHDRRSPSDLEVAGWGLSEESLDVARSISSADWETHARILVERPIGSMLSPDIDLLIRHASGQLFQQAHHLALVPQQLRLPGIPDTDIRHVRNLRGPSGVFFTPPSIARAVVETAIDSIDLTAPTLKIFDPSCGSAEFLKEALRVLQIRRYAGAITLIGHDISPIAIELSRFVLYRDSLGANVTLDLRVKDSIAGDPWPTDVDLLLTNPPFLSWELMSQPQREQVASILGPLQARRPNMANPFILLASRALGPNGALGAVVPASFISGDSSRLLRQELSQKLRPVLLATLGNQMMFHDAIVDASIYVASNRRGNDPAFALWADHNPKSIGAALRGLRRISTQSTRPELVHDNYSIYATSELGRSEESWAPTSFKSYRTLQSLKAFPRLGDLFDVKQGVRLGHKLFVVQAEYYAELSNDEKRFFRPAVVNRSIDHGRLLPLFYVFYPDTSGLPEIVTESALRAAIPRFYAEHLKPNKDALLRRARTDAEQWWKLMWPRTWLQEPAPRIVSTYFGDAGSFAFDESGLFVPVVGNGWIPLKKRLRAPIPTKVWHAYIAFLSSELFATLLAGSSRHVGGGQWDLSKRYISNARIPDLTSAGIAPEVLDALAQIGRAIGAGKEYDVDALNALARAVCNLE